MAISGSCPAGILPCGDLALRRATGYGNRIEADPVHNFPLMSQTVLSFSKKLLHQECCTNCQSSERNESDISLPSKFAKFHKTRHCEILIAKYRHFESQKHHENKLRFLSFLTATPEHSFRIRKVFRYSCFFLDRASGNAMINVILMSDQGGGTSPSACLGNGKSAPFLFFRARISFSGPFLFLASPSCFARTLFRPLPQKRFNPFLKFLLALLNRRGRHLDEGDTYPVACSSRSSRSVTNSTRPQPSSPKPSATARLSASRWRERSTA